MKRFYQLFSFPPFSCTRWALSYWSPKSGITIIGFPLAKLSVTVLLPPWVMTWKLNITNEHTKSTFNFYSPDQQWVKFEFVAGKPVPNSWPEGRTSKPTVLLKRYICRVSCQERRQFCSLNPRQCTPLSQGRDRSAYQFSEQSPQAIQKVPEFLGGRRLHEQY